MDTGYSTQANAAWSPRLRPSDPQPSPLLRWWYVLSAPAPVPASASFTTRERVRRGRLASLLILGLLTAGSAAVATVVLVTPGIFYLSWTIPALVAGMACCLLAIPLNRAGLLLLTALLLMAAVDVSVAGIVLSERSGLDPIFLSLYDLLVVTELIAVSLLSAASVFAVAAVNTALIVLDVALQPHAMMWEQMIMSGQQTSTVLTRPMAIYFLVALVSYALAHSLVRALRRADRAEEIAFLEHRDAERTRELEEGVQQLLAVHVHLANGDFTTRAPAVRNHALWQIASSLNNLIGRLARFAQTASQTQFTLQRTHQEAQRLAQTVSAAASGRQAQWPVPSGTPLDLVIEALRTALARSGANGLAGIAAPASSPLAASPYASLPAAGSPLPSWASVGPTAPSGYSVPDAGQLPGSGEAADLPEWLRPLR